MCSRAQGSSSLRLPCSAPPWQNQTAVGTLVRRRSQWCNFRPAKAATCSVTSIIFFDSCPKTKLRLIPMIFSNGPSTWRQESGQQNGNSGRVSGHVPRIDTAERNLSGTIPLGRYHSRGTCPRPVRRFGREPQRRGCILGPKGRTCRHKDTRMGHAPTMQSLAERVWARVPRSARGPMACARRSPLGWGLLMPAGTPVPVPKPTATESTTRHTPTGAPATHAWPKWAITT